MLMRVCDDETLGAAVVRFEAMYGKHSRENTRSDFGGVTVHTFDTASSPITYMVHDVYVDGLEIRRIPTNPM